MPGHGPSGRSASKAVLSATGGGIAVTVVGHPLDTLKVLLQTQGQPKVYSSLLDCTRKTYHRHGVLGFYKGVGSPLAFQVFFRATIFGSYDVAQNILRTSQDAELNMRQRFAAGMFAGIAGAFVESPVELFKSQVQIEVTRSLQSRGRYTPRYQNVFHCAWDIFRTHGPLGFFQGLGATLARGVPGGAIYFGTYETVKVVVMPFEDLQRLHKAGQAVPAAEEAFRQVVREVLGEEGAAEALADPELAVLSRGGFVWLALAGDEKVPAGCVALHRVAEEGAAAADAGGETGRQTRWELRQLAVRPRWRRQGVGRLLVETLLRQFTEAAGDSEELVLEVPHSCEAARALLLKMGLVEAEAGEGGASSEGAVLMRLGTRTHRASGGPAASASPPAPRADPRYFD